MLEVARRFGENLARCRKRAGLSQEEASLRASLHRTEWSILERGARCPRIDTLVKLTGALGVTPNDLLDGIVWTPAVTSEGRYVETAVTGLGLVSRRFEVEHRNQPTGS
jgi:transcriptional regulator with XRE-family HTH domain